MPVTPFHAMYTARQLSEYAAGADRLVPAYASSDTKTSAKSERNAFAAQELT